MSGPVRRRLERARVTARLARGRLRASLLRVRGGRVGAKVALGRDCVVDRPWCVGLGRRCTVEDHVRFKVVADGAVLTFGERAFVGRGTVLDVMEEVVVGDHTLIGPDCFITDHNHGTSPESRIAGQPCEARRVAIGRDVWLGAKVVVLPGVTIGDGAVVGAHSVVTADVPPGTVVAGVPAAILRDRRSPRPREA